MRDRGGSGRGGWRQLAARMFPRGPSHIHTGCSPHSLSLEPHRYGYTSSCITNSHTLPLTKGLVASMIWPNCLGLDSSTLVCGGTKWRSQPSSSPGKAKELERRVQGLLRSAGQALEPSPALSRSSPFTEEVQLLPSALRSGPGNVGAGPSIGSDTLARLSLSCSLYLEQTWACEALTGTGVPERQEWEQAARAFRNWLAYVPSTGTGTCKPLPLGLETERIRRWEGGLLKLSPLLTLSQPCEGTCDLECVVCIRGAAEKLCRLSEWVCCVLSPPRLTLPSLWEPLTMSLPQEALLRGKGTDGNWKEI